MVILIRDQKVKEYIHKNEVLQGPDAGKAVVKYIESLSTTHFTIRTIIGAGYDKKFALVAQYVLDRRSYAPQPAIRTMSPNRRLSSFTRMLSIALVLRVVFFNQALFFQIKTVLGDGQMVLRSFMFSNV